MKTIKLAVEVPESFFDAAERAGHRADVHLERLVAAYLRGGLNRTEPPTPVEKRRPGRPSSLTEKHLVLIEFFTGEGMTVGEIGKRLGVSPAAVGHARRKLLAARSPELAAAAAEGRGWSSNWDGSRSVKREEAA